MIWVDKQDDHPWYTSFNIVIFVYIPTYNLNIHLKK